MDYEENLTCDLCGGAVDPEYGEETCDGWICEECAARMSPWVESFDLFETDDLEEQLRLRKENQENLRSFCPTRSFTLPGMTEKVYLDDETRTFLVTEDRDIWQENPDILSLDDVIDADVDVSEEREEIGDHLYCYTYELSMNICLEHSYIDEISFALHSEPLQFESEEKSFLGFGGFDPEEEPAYQRIYAFGQDLSDALMDMEEEINHAYDVRDGEFSLDDTEEEEEEAEEETEEDMEDPETEGSPEDAEPEEAFPQAGEIVACPWCGCRTHVTEDLRCELCGGNL